LAYTSIQVDMSGLLKTWPAKINITRNCAIDQRSV
jgi:hypothetical protein